MMRWPVVTVAALFLAVGACSAQPASEENVTNKAGDAPAAKSTLPPCPFKEIHELKGSIEGGRLLVTGRVDLMMAGFKPQLTERSSGGGVLALDLALVPESQAAVSDELRYERFGVSRYPRGEIWCGGERLATFDMILVG